MGLGKVFPSLKNCPSAKPLSHVGSERYDNGQVIDGEASEFWS